MATYGRTSDSQTYYQLVNGLWQQVTDPATVAVINAHLQPGQTGEIIIGGGTTTPSGGSSQNLLNQANALGGNTMAISPGANTELNYDPYTAYLQSLGIGSKAAQTWNPAEAYRESLYNPLKGLYNTYQRFAAAPVSARGDYTPYGTFSDYLGGIGGVTGTNQQPLYSQASRLLSTIFGSSPEQRQELQATYQPGVGIGAAGENVFDPNNIDELQSLLKLGLRMKYGNVGSQYIAAKAPAEQQAFYGQQAAGTQPSGASFLDYLRQRYGL